MRDCPPIYDPAGPYRRFYRRRLHLRHVRVNDMMTTLQCAASRSLERVAAELEREGIRWRYTSGLDSTRRTPKRQRQLCDAICGNPNGCPGLCADWRYGKHVRGIAVDACPVHYKDTALFERIWAKHGWHQPLPDSDRCHHSFRVSG